MDRAKEIIRTAARKGVEGIRGDTGDIIKARMHADDIEGAAQILSQIVRHPRQDNLKGRVGNQIRHALRDQDYAAAESLLRDLATTMDNKGLKGKLGKQLRRLFNQGDKDGAIQLMIDWIAMKAKEKAEKQGGRIPPTSQQQWWFGPPTSIWAAKRAIAAVGSGKAPPEALAAVRDNGGEGAIATAFREWGEDQLKQYPYIGMVITVVDYLRDIPGVGDLITAIEEQIDAWVEKGVKKGASEVKDWAEGLF
jgi:hypothetical protein